MNYLWECKIMYWSMYRSIIFYKGETRKEPGLFYKFCFLFVMSQIPIALCQMGNRAWNFRKLRCFSKTTRLSNASSRGILESRGFLTHLSAEGEVIA